METRDILLVGIIGAAGYFIYEQMNNSAAASTDTTGASTDTTTPPPPVSTIPNQDPDGNEIPPTDYYPSPSPNVPYANYYSPPASGYRGSNRGTNRMPSSTSPMGMRYNNPGNLRPNGSEAHYPTMQAGILAALNNLIAYQHLHGLNTIRGIITRWAPPNENNTAAYINYVASQTGIGADQSINTSDPTTAYNILMAIFANENSGQTPAASLVHSVVTGKLGAFA